MENLFCMSKPSTEYAVVPDVGQLSCNNNADTESSDGSIVKSRMSAKSSSNTAVSSSAVSNEELKEFLEQMKWHINNKLDKTRIEMVELRRKVEAIDVKLETALGDKNGVMTNGEEKKPHPEDEKDQTEGGSGGGGDEKGGGSSSSGGIARGKAAGSKKMNGSFARSFKGVFMNSNNNKLDKSAGGVIGVGLGKEEDEEEEGEKRKTVTFGQEVVVKEIQRVFSGKRRSRKSKKDEKKEHMPLEEEEFVWDLTDKQSFESKKGITQTSNGPLDIEKLRQEAWRNSKSNDSVNEYQNTQVGTVTEDFYELPITNEPPKLPSMDNRPPIPKQRIVDEVEDVYEDPDDSTTESGRGSMPPGSVSDEGSGSTFIFQHGGGEIPVDDYNSDSTDYDEVEVEVTEKPKKKQTDKLQEFKNEHASETDIDLIDRLFYYNNMISTIKGGISLGKWEKRYVIARDNQLMIYKSYKDKKAQRLPMMGLDVWYIGIQTNRDFVFRINHQSMKHPLLMAAESKLEAEKWVAVLKRYSTIDHTIIPSSGFQADEPEEGSGGKKGKLFSRGDKKEKEKEKEKEVAPQLSVESGGGLSGFVNIYGVKYGEPKIKKKWITVKNTVFSCSTAKDDVTLFSFNMKGMQIEIADKKEVKMKGAFKLIQDGEVLLYIETLNILDAGYLLKALVAPSLGKQPDRTSTVGSDESAEDGMVRKLLAAFENSSSKSDETDNIQRPASLDIPDGTYVGITESPSQESVYVNSSITTNPHDTMSRRRKLGKIFQNNRKSCAPELDVTYENTTSPSDIPDQVYDDIDLPAAPQKTPQQRKVMTLPSMASQDKSQPTFEELYLEVVGDDDLAPVSPNDDLTSPVSPQAPSTPQSRIKNLKKLQFRGGKKEKEAISLSLDVPQGEKVETEKERKQREKKEKKEKKEKEKKEKEDKKKKKKEEEAAAEEKPAPSPGSHSPGSLHSGAVKKEEVKKSPGLERKPSATLNKFKDSEMSHLLLKDKLMQERKELEDKKRAATRKKADLRAKMMSESDPTEKEKLKKQVEAAQSEWSEINKKLVKISVEIESATAPKKDTVSNGEKSEGTVSAGNRSSVRAPSPDREKVSKGTVQDRMKMFQQGN
ncbi:uncharacterized protein [Diadema setosum]|uniref:uncharacterized protein n=1 Tax=Diadema setosum TaxID=31175 RepID=UPI003B3A490A